MKFCTKCGKETVDEAVICVHCGCSINGNYQSLDNPSILWTLLAIWQPLIGIILYCVWKDDKPLTAKCIVKGVIASIIISVVLIALFLLFWFLMFGLALSGSTM